MKRKASQELSQEGTDEAAEQGEGRQVASSVTVIDPDGDLQMDFVVRTNDDVVRTNDDVVHTNNDVVRPDDNVVRTNGDVVRPDENDGQLRGLLVNKHTLRLSSPVFRTMLADNSPFHESRSKTTNPDGIQVIHFEDDDVATMEILMNAIHLQNHKVPMFVTITQFEELAIVCDKYDIRCLGPWAEIWSKHHLDQDCSSLPRPLFIASVFKLADWFVRLTRELILKTTLSSEGELLLEYSSHFREGVPQSILDRIAERRTDVIAQLLELCWQQSCDLRLMADDHCQCGEWERERRNCDLTNLGNLTLHFPDIRGSYLDDAELYSASAHGVLSTISKMIPESDTSLPDHYTINHECCCVGRTLEYHAKTIIDSVDGIELEAVASRATPPQSTQPSPLSSFIERKNDTLGSPHFELAMRLTAVPNSTKFWPEVAVQSQATSDTRYAWCPKLKCIHCPGFEYSLFQHGYNELRLHEAINKHIPERIHWARRRKAIKSSTTVQK